MCHVLDYEYSFSHFFISSVSPNLSPSSFDAPLVNLKLLMKSGKSNILPVGLRKAYTNYCSCS